MPQRTIQQTLEIALQHHQAGQLPQAEALYRQILSQQPNNADVLHLLGCLGHQVGQNDRAVELIVRAIALKPNFPEAYSNLGNALKDKGQLDEAIAAYNQAITRKPNFPEAHSNLGVVLNSKGQLDESIAAFRQAIALKHNYPEAYYNLGNALNDKGQRDEAIAAFRQAIAMNPHWPEAHYILGIALYDQAQLDESIAAFRQAIALRSNWPEAYYNLGNVLNDKGQIDEAIAAYRQAIALNSNYSKAHYNLGNTLKDKGQLDEAIAAYRQAIILKPDYAEAYSNLGNAWQTKGQMDAAIAAYHQAIVLNPSDPEEHRNLAFALLLKGHFFQGFSEYEWRLKCKEFAFPRRNFPQPQWDGRILAGASILLHAEQGLGDTIQFIRYLPLVKQKGGRIIVECQAELLRLLQTMAVGCSIVVKGQPLPAFDVQCPLLSLPLAFGTTLENIPRQVPFINAGALMTEKWRKRLATDSKLLKVGLVWAGNKMHKNDRNRSMALSALAPLARLQGVSFYSLQKGGQADQAKNPPNGLQLTDWTEELNDFSDTAALIANLDLVISVDTAVAHLAGAMGKPVWVLLPFAPDWRWMLEREDSPWYPTMRLFRQPTIGDWDNVMRQVVDALAAMKPQLPPTVPSNPTFAL